jgi:putative nucleotidyltransferase with HDIG domain
MHNHSVSADAPQLKASEVLCKLPPFRPVALKLLRLVTREDVNFSEVSNLLSVDPGFSAEILALANSPLYGGVSRTTSLTRAIVVLGLERTRSLTMTVAMQAFVTNVQVTAELQRCWRHSLGCALVAEELAPMYGITRDHGYTAGLLHDLGRLGLLKAYAKPYAVLLADTYENAAQLLDAERDRFEMDHCQAGLWLTRSWGFPEEFQSIAARHHDGRFTPDQGIVALAGVSCVLADTLGFSCMNYQQAATIEETMAALPGKTPFDMEAIRARILERVQSVDLGG